MHLGVLFFIAQLQFGFGLLPLNVNNFLEVILFRSISLHLKSLLD